jgi:hypothetical protein
MKFSDLEKVKKIGISLIAQGPFSQNEQDITLTHLNVILGYDIENINLATDKVVLSLDNTTRLEYDDNTEDTSNLKIMSINWFDHFDKKIYNKHAGMQYTQPEEYDIYWL